MGLSRGGCDLRSDWDGSRLGYLAGYLGMTHTTAANDRYAQLLALSRMGASRDEAARSVGLSLAGMHGLLWRRLGSGVWPVVFGRES